MNGHFIFLTGKSHKDEVSFMYIYAPNIKEYKFEKEILLNLKIHIKPHSARFLHPTLTTEPDN